MAGFRRSTAGVLALALCLTTMAARPASAGVTAAKAQVLGRVEIHQAELRLRELGYWTGPVDGTWDGVARQALIAHLRAHGILSVFHYLPLHLSPVGLRFGGRQGDCPITEDLADCLIRFPFFSGMSSSEQTQVIEAVRGFRS